MKKLFKKLLGIICLSPIFGSLFYLLYIITKDNTLQDWKVLGIALAIVFGVIGLGAFGISLLIDEDDY